MSKTWATIIGLAVLAAGAVGGYALFHHGKTASADGAALAAQRDKLGNNAQPTSAQHPNAKAPQGQPDALTTAVKGGLALLNNLLIDEDQE